MMAEVYELNAWKHQLQQGDRGPKRNLTNLMLHLRNITGLKGQIRYNSFCDVVEFQGKPLVDTDLIDIRLILEREGFQPTDKDVRPAVERVAAENEYCPITNYLDSISWDGIPRLDRWMIKLLGAPDNAFTRAVGPKFLIAAVARAREPGCKVDTILVLEGAQGLKKSSSIAALFGEEYSIESTSLFDQHNKMVMQLTGAWAVELSEFVAIARKDQSQVKGLISMRSDRVVLSYAKRATSHPRRFVFVATINPDEGGYLTDNTGNRRYWPVQVTKVDLENIRAKRDQLWAEAQHRYAAGERWWLEGDETALAETETEGREQADVWQSILEEKLRGVSSITPAKAMSELGIPYERMGRGEQMRIAKALKNLGFLSETPKDARGKTYRIWVRGAP